MLESAAHPLLVDHLTEEHAPIPTSPHEEIALTPAPFDTPTTPPPRPTILQRLSHTRASTALSFLLALTIHAALIALAYAHYNPSKSLQLPDLVLPQGWAADDAPFSTPSHPTVTFVDNPSPPTHEDRAPLDATPPKDLLTPPATDFASPAPASTALPDLALGTVDVIAPPGPTSKIPPSPARPSAPATTATGATDTSATESAAPSQSAASSSAAGAPQGTPDTPPVPSTRNQVPPYPREALRRRIAGTVVLELHIAATGHVTDAVIQQSSGHDLLDRSAHETALTWTFTPALLDGHPVPITVRRPVNFIPPR